MKRKYFEAKSMENSLYIFIFALKRNKNTEADRSKKKNTEGKQSEQKNTEAKIKIQKRNKAKRKVLKQKEKYGSKPNEKKHLGSERKQKIYAKFSLKHAKRKLNESRFALKPKNLKRNRRPLLPRIYRGPAISDDYIFYTGIKTPIARQIELITPDENCKGSVVLVLQSMICFISENYFGIVFNSREIISTPTVSHIFHK
jgi:beta-glucosidase-like glycosyl hydrolase